MKRVALASFLIASVLGLTGCSTITASFKAGAGPGTTADDEKACRESGTGEAAFLECMRAKGYFMSGPDVAAPAPVPVAAPAAAPVAAAPVAVPTAVATAAAEAMPKPVPVASATATPVVAAPAAPAAAVAPAVAPPGSESLPRVHVRSWWKLGGTASGLDASIATCVKKLGPPHQPAAGAVIVTAAMRDCLRDEGWHAYDEAPVE